MFCILLIFVTGKESRYDNISTTRRIRHQLILHGMKRPLLHKVRTALVIGTPVFQDDPPVGGLEKTQLSLMTPENSVTRNVRGTSVSSINRNNKDNDGPLCRYSWSLHRTTVTRVTRDCVTHIRAHAEDPRHARTATHCMERTRHRQQRWKSTTQGEGGADGINRRTSGSTNPNVGRHR